MCVCLFVYKQPSFWHSHSNQKVANVCVLHPENQHLWPSLIKPVTTTSQCFWTRYCRSIKKLAIALNVVTSQMQPWEPSQTKNTIPNYKHLESQTLSHRRHFVTFEMDSQTNALWFDTSGRARKYPLTPQRSFRMTFLWAREADRESECKKHRKRGKGQKREKTSNHSLLPSSSGSWLADSSLVDFSVALGHGYITHTWKLLSRLSLIAGRARLGWKWRDIACVRNQRGEKKSGFLILNTNGFSA